MMIRVDLLDPSERRYMGPVSSRFAKRIALFTLVALAVIGGGGGLYNSIECRRAIQRGRGRWQDLEPRYEAAERLKRRHAELGQYLDEIRAWTNIRLAAHSLLEDIQGRVPADIQFTRLEIRDEIAASRPKSSEEVVVPFRLLRMRLNGRAAGDRAEEIVARFISRLREIGAGEVLFRSVTLQAIQADPLAAGPVGTFEIDAVGTERPLKLK